MKKSEYWRIRKGIKYGIINAMSKLNNYEEKDSYLRRWDSNPSEFKGIKRFYNEEWDIIIDLYQDSSYSMI